MRFPIFSMVMISAVIGLSVQAMAEQEKPMKQDTMMKAEMMKEEMPHDSMMKDKMMQGEKMSSMASFKPYTAEAFKAAQMAGQPVVIHVHKDGCPTCAAQEVAFQDILKSDKLADVAFLRVNYKGQPEIVQELGAKMQSTLIVYGKDGKELSRTAGETDATKLKAQIEAVGATM